MLNKIKNVVNKLFGKDEPQPNLPPDNFQFKVVKLTPEQAQYKVESTDWEDFKNTGFEIVTGKYKSVIARLNMIQELPSESGEKDGNLTIQFDYTVVSTGTTGIDLDIINDDNSDECINFIPYARGMFQMFVNQSLEHMFKETLKTDE